MEEQKTKKTLPIEFEDFTLRAFKLEDAQDMFDNYCSDDLVTKYVNWFTHKNVEETKDYLKSFLSYYDKENYYHWAIVDKQTQKVIGAIGEVNSEQNQKELGWVLSKDYWNKGLMTKAVKAVLNYLFDRDIETVLAKCCSQNLGSSKVMQNSGLRFFKVSDEKLAIKTGKEEQDFQVYFKITKAEFEKQHYFENAYKAFGKAWGFVAQASMAVEETSELNKEIMKYLRYSRFEQTPEVTQKLADIKVDLIQEVADALNCVEQVKFLVGAEEVEKIRKQKIERTFQRMDGLKHK